MSKFSLFMQVCTSSKNYEILFVGGETYQSIGAKILSHFNAKSYIILTEKNIPSEYYNGIYHYLEANGANIHLIKLDSIGEKNKDFKVLTKVSKSIFENVTLTRNSVLIAIGGGVIGDLGGFLASILMRGIRFVQMPTTLLAMTDSSIGGKTGINAFGYKNVIGAFYQPDMVICNANYLKTLPYEEYISGYAEILKHAILTKEHVDFLPDLLKNEHKIASRDMRFLTGIIKISCQIKANIVSRDEREQNGVRAFLNFGHTIAHAVEKLKELDGRILHGHAVAIGMIAELKLAYKLGYFKDYELISILETHFENIKLPARLEQLIEVNSRVYRQILAKVTLDKKNHRNIGEDIMISFAIPKKIGAMENIRISLSSLKKLLSDIL
ncbi:3-dehydroquinate synthase [Candidatus Deianiraea vastatrix]|nr:3-dehydroquinate synthase [Candidatus Deianiraea vastatrix]